MRLLAYDEHRLGLRPVYRRVWARRGERPSGGGGASVPLVLRLHLCGAGDGGEPEPLVDGMDTEVMSWVLRELRAWLGRGGGVGSPRPGGMARVGAGGGAGGVRLVFLPPYSPELQPVERVWPLVNEAVANRYFRDLEEMMEVVAERCRVLAGDPETLRRHTLFHWWPRMRESA